MIILHIASIEIDSYTGVSVAVPQHIKAQQYFAEVGFINITNAKIDGIANQFGYERKLSISKLPEPFCTPDLIVFHEIYRVDFLRLSKQARNKIPYVVVPHGTLTREAQNKKHLKKVVANALLFNTFINGAEAIQFLSERESNNSRFGKRKLIGTNGVIIRDEKKQQSDSQGIKFLYIGSLALDIKGLDLMLEAIKETSTILRASNAKLYLFGPDYKMRHSDIRNLVEKLEIGDLVELNDKIAGDAKKAEILSADIFIQTSRTEGMSMGILEALSYGVPCLVTEGTNLGQIIKEYDAGWMARTDSHSIADAIRNAIIERNAWKTKSNNGVILIEENFLWSKVAENTIDSYKEICGGFKRHIRKSFS